MSLTKKLTQLVNHWSESMLETARNFSSNNDYTPPPTELIVSEEAILAVYRKMQNFCAAIPNAAQAKSLIQNIEKDAQKELPLTIIETSQLIEGQTIEVKGHVKLMPPNSNLWQKNIHFIITQSDAILDCQGALLSSTDNKITAIVIQTPTNKKGIQNIQIKNGIFVGYNHGLSINQQTPANQRYEHLLSGSTSIEAQLEQSPHDILIDNVTITHSRNSGIFLGDHVHHVDFNRIAVVRSGTVGLYFEFGSRDNVVRNSFFSQNGVRQVNGSGKPNREAIAIDSSAYNRIEQCYFDHNGAGGIFLYRNCFEHADDPTQPNHFLRTQGSDSNIIQSNVFEREAVGVWIASRQSRNLKGFACGAYTISETPFSSYHLDEAEENKIIGNLFITNKTGIIVEDDNNTLKANQFEKDVEQPIVIGSKIRLQSIEGAVKNNILVDNRIVDNYIIDKEFNENPKNLIKFVSTSDEDNIIQP